MFKASPTQDGCFHPAECGKHKNVYNSLRFAENDVEYGVAVAQSFTTHSVCVTSCDSLRLA